MCRVTAAPPRGLPTWDVYSWREAFGVVAKPVDHMALGGKEKPEGGADTAAAGY